MNKKIAIDLVDASEATEHLLKQLPDLSLEDQVDIAARIRAVVKNCEAIDRAIKDGIKKKLKNKDGTVLGDIFKANLAYTEVSRFDTTGFKEAHREQYEKWCVVKSEGRVTFEPR